MSKKLFLAAFLVLAAAQWFVPLSSIRNWERVLTEGETYKFLTAPVDPTDLFRGKYMRLSFSQQEIRVDTTREFVEGASVYLVLKTDTLGYAEVVRATLDKPADGQPYVKGLVNWMEDDGTLHYQFPFNTYFLEESKAGDAELAYREAEMDTAQVAYAVVRILDGTPVLEDVIINGKPILEVVEELRRNQAKK